MKKKSGKILVIDDDDSVLLLSRYLLNQQYTNVITLKDPGKLPVVLKENHINVALLDMNFTIGETTGQEGFDLLRYFTKNAPATRVVMMTAHSDVDIAIKAIKEGADDFIVKPWENTKFLRVISGAFQKYPGRKSLNSKPVNTPISNYSLTKNITEVNRVFMFLDIISATAIAEQLGHIKYFELLNDFFEDLAEPIKKFKGKIYQYVGDEVVVSWSLEEGTDNANCIRCFFEIEDTIGDMRRKYMSKYNLIPKYKAGVHCGRVTTGVVGTYKKEIVYTGDVLNTTSRIEGQCNFYGVNLLISKDLYDLLNEADNLDFDKMGDISLRGKALPIALYTCNRV